MRATDPLGQRHLHAACIAVADGELADVPGLTQLHDDVAAVGIAAQPELIRPFGCVGAADAVIHNLPAHRQRAATGRGAIATQRRDPQVGVGTGHYVDHLRDTTGVVRFGVVFEDFAVRVADHEQAETTAAACSKCDAFRAGVGLAGDQYPIVPVFADDQVVGVAEDVVAGKQHVVGPVVEAPGAASLVDHRPGDGQGGRICDQRCRCADRSDRQVGVRRQVDRHRNACAIVTALAVVEYLAAVADDEQLVGAGKIERYCQVGTRFVAVVGRQRPRVADLGKHVHAVGVAEEDLVVPAAERCATTVAHAPFDMQEAARGDTRRRACLDQRQIDTRDAQRVAGTRHVVVLGAAFVEAVVAVGGDQPAPFAVGQ